MKVANKEEKRNMLLSRMREWEKIKSQEKEPDALAFVQETIKILEEMSKKGAQNEIG